MLNTLLMVALASAPAPAPSFADYVFTVPVRIENMTHVTAAWVNCSLSHVSTDGNRYDVGVPLSGRVEIPLRDGAFTGNITSTVRADPTSLARGRTPTRWSCFVSYDFRLPDGSMFRASSSGDDLAAAYARSTGQEITTITHTVSGAIPPG